MNQESSALSRRNERGEGQAKLLVFLAGLFLAGFAGLQYVPVAYNASSLKQEMQTLVDQATIMPGAKNDPVAWIQKKLAQTMASHSIPADAKVEVKKTNEVALTATVSYTAQVSILPFGIYDYPYQFSHTATTDSFLTK